MTHACRVARRQQRGCGREPRWSSGPCSAGNLERRVGVQQRGLAAKRIFTHGLVFTASNATASNTTYMYGKPSQQLAVGHRVASSSTLTDTHSRD